MKPWSSMLLATTIVAGLVPASARAESGETRSVVEPVSIEEVLPTEPGETDLRFGTRYSRPMSDGGWSTFSHSAQVFVGLGPGVSLEATLPFVVARTPGGSQSGMGASALGLKWRCTPEDALPLVLRVEGTLPASDEALGETASEFEASLGTAWRGERLMVQGSAGGSWTAGSEERGALYGASIAMSAAERWTVFAEAAGAYSVPERRNLLGVGPAIQYAVGPEMLLAAGVLFGVGTESEQLGVRAYFQRGF